MTMPIPLCPNRMQVHSIQQETEDVWTLSLINADFYPYQPGQYALVSIRHSAETLRAYTLSSSPGLSPFIQLSVRRLPDGTGSRWLTQEVKPGDYLWLSDAQGEFTCQQAQSDHYLMLAAGCGVTPIMSMSRWLVTNRPQADIQVFLSVRSPADVIFAAEWQTLTARYPQQLRLTLIAEHQATPDFLSGRLTEEILRQRVVDLPLRTVMTCGPAAYMTQVETLCRQLGVSEQRFFKEQFHTAAEEIAPQGDQLKITQTQLLREFYAPVGSTLLFALEQNKVPIAAACRAGVCGSCKTRILSGDYTRNSTMTLTADELAQGYVLACSCQLHGDITLA